MASSLQSVLVEELPPQGAEDMESTYWENLQPFVEVEASDPPVEFDKLRALFLALQGALCEARRLGEQVAAEYAFTSSHGTNSRNQPEGSIPPRPA